MIAVLRDGTARQHRVAVGGIDITSAVQPASVGGEVSIARVIVAAQYGHRVPCAPRIATALDDDSTGIVLMVDIALAIRHVEIPLEPARSGEHIVQAVIRYATDAENFHRVDSL